MESGNQGERLLRLPEVEARTGLKKSAIYVRMSNGSFPRCIRLGRIVAWPASRIDAWVAQMIAESQQQTLLKDGR